MTSPKTNTYESNSFKLGRISNSPKFIQKLMFLQKHAQKVFVSQSSVSSSSISIHMENLCNCEFGISLNDLVEMVKNLSHFSEESVFEISDEKLHGEKLNSGKLSNQKLMSERLINEKSTNQKSISERLINEKLNKPQLKSTSTDKFIKYTFTNFIGDIKVVMNKKIPLITLDFKFNFENPILTAKIQKFRCISSDPTTVKFHRNQLIFETNEYVKTKITMEAQKVDGIDSFEILVSGKELKIANDFENEIVLCYYRDCLVFFSFEGEISVALIVSILLKN